MNTDNVEPRKANRRKIYLLALLPLACGALVFSVFFVARTSATGAVAAKDAPTTTLGAEVREHADYKIDGDVVYVNNTICAQMGSPLSPEAMGKFTSKVVYDGPVEKFKGKTLVFNQCCGGCAASFPDKWARERDQIMIAHGLVQ